MSPFERKRRVAGLTQTGLAAMLGVSQSAVRNWENGVKIPHPSRTKKIAKIFKMTPEDFTHLFDEQATASAK